MAAPKATGLKVKANVTKLVAEAETYTTGLKDTKLNALRGEIKLTCHAAETFSPIYRDELVKVRAAKQNSDETISPANFATMLQTEARILKGNDAYVFPIDAVKFAVILNWTGDQKEHDANEVPFLNWCAAQREGQTFSNYMRWLKGWRADVKHYDEDGELTAAGQKIAQDAADLALRMAREVWSSFNIRENTDGLSSVELMAWCQALKHDVESLMAETIAATPKADRAKLSQDAARLRKSYTSKGKPVAVTGKVEKVYEAHQATLAAAEPLTAVA